MHLLVLFTVLLIFLWMPACLMALKLKRLGHSTVLRLLRIVLPVQLLLTIALCLLADWAGLHNPAGYTLAVCFLIGQAGVIFLWLHRKRRF